MTPRKKDPQSETKKSRETSRTRKSSSKKERRKSTPKKIKTPASKRKSVQIEDRTSVKSPARKEVAGTQLSQFINKEIRFACITLLPIAFMLFRGDIFFAVHENIYFAYILGFGTFLLLKRAQFPNKNKYRAFGIYGIDLLNLTLGLELLLGLGWPSLWDVLIPVAIYVALFLIIMKGIPKKYFDKYFASNELVQYALTLQFCILFAIDLVNLSNKAIHQYNDKPFIIILCWLYISNGYFIADHIEALVTRSVHEVYQPIDHAYNMASYVLALLFIQAYLIFKGLGGWYKVFRWNEEASDHWVFSISVFAFALVHFSGYSLSAYNLYAKKKSGRHIKHE